MIRRRRITITNSRGKSNSCRAFDSTWRLRVKSCSAVATRGNEAVSLHLCNLKMFGFTFAERLVRTLFYDNNPARLRREDMQFAADLAAFHSKVRNDGKVQVSYTSPKNVRKPSGVSRLGMVTITKEEVFGRPDDSISFKTEKQVSAQAA